MPELALSTQSPSAVTDTLAVFLARGDDGPQLLDDGRLPAQAREHLVAAMDVLRVTGKADEVARFTGVPGLAAALVLTTGVGAPPPAPAAPDAPETGDPQAAAPIDDPSVKGVPGAATDAPGAGAGTATAESLRRAAGAAARAAAGRAGLALLAPDGRPSTAPAIGQGAALGAYRFTDHRSTKAAERLAKDAPVGAVEVLVAAPDASASPSPDGVASGDDALARAGVVATWQRWARDLVNTAPNVLYPQSFAERVIARAPAGVTVEVLDEQALADGGFGGIVGVGQGSARPPRLVALTYEPDDCRGHLAYVGKGITFDSGGLCLKPPKSMITMKCDMGGAAAVAAAVCAIAELGLPIAVTGYLCLAENMPGSDAQRPSDVVTIRDGQTVEVINTDAEGRMVLVDGISLAAEQDPDAIIDVATLTGAAMVALGSRTAAVFANDDALQGELTSAATSVGENVWPMPITEEIRPAMDSLVADIAHTGADYGGAMTAAAFLRAFAGTDDQGAPIPWGHLDIAGPAYNESSPHGYTLKGGTGFATRTLVEFARARSEQ